MLYPPQNNDTWSFTLSWIIGIQGTSFSTDCWSPHLLKRWTVFVFSPVLLLLLRMLQLRSDDHPSMALSGDSRLRTGQDAHCTLELCREPPACCKYLSFGMAGKPAEQLNTVVRSCEELWLRGAALNCMKSPDVLLGLKETNHSFHGRLRSELWLVFSVVSSANLWLHSQEALGFSLVLGTKTMGVFFLILHLLALIWSSDSSQHWTTRRSRLSFILL